VLYARGYFFIHWFCLVRTVFRTRKGITLRLADGQRNGKPNMYPMCPEYLPCAHNRVEMIAVTQDMSRWFWCTERRTNRRFLFAPCRSAVKVRSIAGTTNIHTFYRTTGSILRLHTLTHGQGRPKVFRG
jgi:hypothetical protein